MYNQRYIYILILLLVSSHNLASEFIYQPAGSNDDPQRKIIYEFDTLDINETNNETGLWSQGFAPLIPGDTQALSSGSALAGVVHLSDLQTTRMCASVSTWNFLFDDDPTAQQNIESSLLIPFTLSQPATVKVHFSGAGQFINASNGFQLFTGQDFRLRSGLGGNGPDVVQYQGSGVDYVDLPAGDYQLSTGTNDSLFCSPFPCAFQSVSSLDMTVEIMDAGVLPGDSQSKPYLPHLVILDEDIEQQFVDANGALIYRGATQISQYQQTAGGWYAINARNWHHISAVDTNNQPALISAVQLPDQINGQILLQIGDISLGLFEGNQTVVMADYAQALGGLLISGNQGIMGVETVTVISRPRLSQQLNNRCGFANQLAIQLNFDSELVDVDIQSVLIQDPVFAGRFD